MEHSEKKMPRRSILFGAGLAGLGLSGLSSVVTAQSKTMIIGRRETIDIETAAHRISERQQLTSVEKDALRISTAFLRAWEKPDLDTIVGFFSLPCTIKYGGTPDARTYDNEHDVRALISRTIAGGRQWDARIVESWLIGPVVIHDLIFRVSLPGKPVEQHPDVFVANVLEGKIRQWLDFAYAPTVKE